MLNRIPRAREPILVRFDPVQAGALLAELAAWVRVRLLRRR
jgi:hypothetical protein